MDYFYRLDQIKPEHRRLVGDKALYLSNLLQKGYAVLPGLVIPSQRFHTFLETTRWLEPLLADLPNSFLYLNVENSRQLQAIARQIQQNLELTSLPEVWLSQLEQAMRDCVPEGHPSQAPVILRPSLALEVTAAGRYSSFDLSMGQKASRMVPIQVCPLEVNALATSLKRVWASLFRARNLYYWQKMGIQLPQIHLAVLVQPLQSTLVAGLLDVDENRLEVQAVWGLGLGLSQGEIQPDVYQVHLETGAIVNRSVGQKTLAYQLIDPPGGWLDDTTSLFQSAGQSGPPLLEMVADPFFQSCIQVQLLEGQYQQGYTLQANEISYFSRLAHQLVKDFGSPLVLEWLLCPGDGEVASRLYLTQMNFYPTVRLELPQASPATRLDSPPSAAQSRRGDKRAGLGQPDVIGLGAAPGQAAAPVQVVGSQEALTTLTPGTVLVTSWITPDWLPQLQQVAAIVVEQGGVTSHAAIIARELGIPAVVNAPQATRSLQSGDWVLVDGNRGEVYRVDSTSALVTQVAAQPEQPLRPDEAGDGVHATRLMVNLSRTENLADLVAKPLDGVGLVRSELLMLSILEQQHPSLWLRQGRQIELTNRLTGVLQEFARAFTPRPVFYRSLDLRSHEFPNLAGNELPIEVNPVLGLRGTFSYVVDPALFDLELNALYQVHRAGYSNVHLLLPFVRTVEEFLFCQQRVHQAGLGQNPYFELWIMAEVPSILFLLPDYVRAGVQGISIGTNDLTQLLLGVDRDHSAMTRTFEARHPAVLRAVKQLIQQARQLGLPCSICGQATVDHPEIIDMLIQAGITAISVEPGALDQTYQAIGRAERHLLLESARQNWESQG